MKSATLKLIRLVGCIHSDWNSLKRIFPAVPLKQIISVWVIEYLSPCVARSVGMQQQVRSLVAPSPLSVDTLFEIEKWKIGSGQSAAFISSTPCGINIHITGGEWLHHVTFAPNSHRYWWPATNANHIMNAEFPRCAITLMDCGFYGNIVPRNGSGGQTHTHTRKTDHIVMVRPH